MSTAAYYDTDNYFDDGTKERSPETMSNFGVFWLPATMEIDICRRQLVRTLRSFLSLSERWDGSSARQIDPESLATATRVLEELDRLPDDVFPTPRGTVQFEFDTDTEGLEVEISRDAVSYLREFGDGHVEEWSSSSVETIVTEVTKLGPA